MAAFRALSLLGSGVVCSSQEVGTCKQHSLDFILLAGDTLSAQIEDDIRQDLSVINITVNTRLLEKEDFNKAMQDGDFHLCFTESWGPPYDPHTFVTGWFQPNNEAHYPVLDGLEAPMTKETLQQMVTDVLKTENHAERQTQWTAILQGMHNQAISNPMWGRRMPAVLNRRLNGYAGGPQQFDYPVHQIEVLSGSSSVTVAPGAQTGLFSQTGPMEPHAYRPNEFFISNWIYEGLVSYGANGVILPQLATKWTVADTAGGGEEYRFTLRTGVKFHDDTDFNCAAVKMTFDHVLQPPLNTDQHGWMHLPNSLKNWVCDGEVFVATTSDKYYPFLQELSLIRPLRILSPNCYSDGPTSDPVQSNSCPTANDPQGDVRCRGITCKAGTGPWKYHETVTRNDDSIDTVKFLKNGDWWGAHGGIEELIVKNYQDSDAVKSALLNGDLDMMVGGGVLTPNQVQEIDRQHASQFEVSMGPPLMNTIVVMNAARAPTDDLHLRKVIMHAVDKASIVDAELAGSARVADSVFPKFVPYCDVDLTPRWDYDLEKARLMNCPPVTIRDSEVTEVEESKADDAEQTENQDMGLILGLCLGIGIPLLLVVGAASFFVGKRAGYKQIQDKPGNAGAMPGMYGKENA